MVGGESSAGLDQFLLPPAAAHPHLVFPAQHTHAATAVILSVKFVDNDGHWAEVSSHQAALSELAALPVTLPCNKTVPANSNSKMKLIFAAWKF